MLANLENWAVATELEKVSFHSNPKERQCQRILKLQHNYTHLSTNIIPVQLLSHGRLFATPWTTAHQASLSIRIHPNSCPSSRWCHPTIPSSAIPFFSCLQSFPASGSFQMSQLFTWGGQIIGVSASASVLHKNIQDWSLEWIGWISLQSKGLSTVFSNTTVQKHQFFCAQLSL